MTHVGNLAPKGKESSSLKTVDIKGKLILEQLNKIGASPSILKTSKYVGHYGDKLADNTHPNVDREFRPGIN